MAKKHYEETDIDRLLKLIVGDEVMITIAIPKESRTEIHTGKIVFVFPRNERPETNDIKKYYGIDESHQKFQGLTYTPLSNRLVVDKGDGTYYIFAQTARFVELMDAEIKITRQVLRRRARP